MKSTERGITNFCYAWKKNNIPALETGISLHGHTSHSHESLAFLPGAVKKAYILPYLLHKVEKRFAKNWNTELDYSLGYWTSPVPPEKAYALESKQIESYGFTPLVSITDHDEISACKDIVSLEWTAPYLSDIFHIGIHNLPVHKAGTIFKMLLSTADNSARTKDSHALIDALSEVAKHRESLIVMNHPLVDQGRIGHEIHASHIREFLKNNGEFIHALELNALQPHSVNRRVAVIGREWGIPFVAGGDRHGFEPNGAINITDAATFGEFAGEIRERKISTILFMPQYSHNLKLRYAKNVAAIMGKYPELGERARWHDRVFYQCPDGITRSLTEMTSPTSGLLNTANKLVGALKFVNRLVQPADILRSMRLDEMNF